MDCTSVTRDRLPTSRP